MSASCVDAGSMCAVCVCWSVDGQASVTCVEDLDGIAPRFIWHPPITSPLTVTYQPLVQESLISDERNS